MVFKDSLTRGMEATREKIVMLGGCWGPPGVEGVEEEVEDPVADIARGSDGGGGGEGRRREGWDFSREGLGSQPFYQVEHQGSNDSHVIPRVG